MVTLTVQVRGEAEILRELAAWSRYVPEAVEAAIYQEGQEWADVAEARAPMRTGELRGSTFVSLPQGRGADAVVEVGFGAAHAALVHKRRRTASGEPKWLAHTMRELIPGFGRRLRDKARSHMLSRRGAAGVDARWPTSPPSGSSRGSIPDDRRRARTSRGGG